MKISEIYSAKGLKVKLNYEDTSVTFKEGILVRIEPAQERKVFFVSQYGVGAENDKPVLCKSSSQTSDYLFDLFDGEKNDQYRCMFLIDGVEEQFLEIQAYVFQSVTEYKTPVVITVNPELLEKTTLEKLSQIYIWNQLGAPALFCLNYKNKKKQHANVRFIGGKRFLIAQNTVRGIIAESESYLKDKYDVPVDIFIAPEVRFVSESDQPYVNNELSEKLEKISNPASYFARWEAYDELSKRLLDQESEEFGELHYTSYFAKTEVNGTTFEFNVDEELDDSMKGKELGASECESITEQLAKTPVKKHQFGVGQIRRINGKVITTFKESDEDMDILPQEGVLKLYTAGDRYIMARRLAARERMIGHKTPIKSLVALIESGVSGYELPSAWGSNKGVTEKLRQNFKKAGSLNPQQIAALELAINTPDIALIQGPPGTGKTTVIKAICERFREIFEAREKEQQKIHEDYILRSPKILITSFQNEAVDNAISAPLPGDIPAYRKTAKRTKDSSKEQYQKSLAKWYAGLCETINGMIDDFSAPRFVEKKRELNDAFLSYKNAGEPITKAAELINQYLGYVDIEYPKELVAKAKAIISAAQAAEVAGEYEDPIIVRLEAQRLTHDAFEDDGVRNARRLGAYLRINDDLNVSQEICEAIDRVCEDDFSEEDFSAYTVAVEMLKKRFCRPRVYINSDDKDTINECILALGNAFSKHYMNTLDSLESKKSLILSEFLSRLEQDYESIVQKYSMTTAATCQTSLDLRNGVEQTFDLVIVDEAARANPLDLFIPMSMGKKIVLVGDHKQLPHMLEPDVLKVLTEDSRFQDIPEIEKSLFERLFEMFSKGQRVKAIPLTYQYRMHPQICEFVSDAFYDGLLKTAHEITEDVRSSPKEINKGIPLTLVNIPISKGAEIGGVSKSRWVEVEAIGKDIRHILDVSPNASIGIITFYSAQAKLISNHLDSFLNDEEKSNIEIGTVDAFQGKEFEYVLLSCVRSNLPRKAGESPNVGFLEKPNRLCVAFSRAIRQMVVYGDIETLRGIDCFSKLYAICADDGGGYYREY